MIDRSSFLALIIFWGLFSFLLSSVLQASGLAGYPLYHSMYETFYLVNDILDPSFEYHRVIARVCAELARNLADSLILPFKASDYAFKMRRSLDGPDGLKEAYEEKMATRGLSFGRL